MTNTARLKSDHDLAKLRVGFEIAVSFNDIVKHEGPGDLRRERAAGQSINNEDLRKFQAGRIADEFVHQISPQGQAL